MARRKAERFDGREVYRALHGGLAPSRTARIALYPRPKHLVDLGPVLAVEYEKRLPEGNIPYRHPFDRRAAPTLAHDEHGLLHFVGGRYDTTARGIVDERHGPMPRGEVGAMRYNPEMSPQARTAVFGLKVTAVLLATWLIARMIQDRITRLQKRTTGLAESVVLVLGGVMLSRKHPAVGLGLIAGGLVTGTQALGVDSWIDAHLRSATNTPAEPPITGVSRGLPSPQRSAFDVPAPHRVRAAG